MRRRGGQISAGYGGGTDDWMLDNTELGERLCPLTNVGITMDNTAAPGHALRHPMTDDAITGIVATNAEGTSNSAWSPSSAWKPLSAMTAYNMTADSTALWLDGSRLGHFDATSLPNFSSAAWVR